MRMKHEGGSVRCHGINMVLKGVSIFFKKFFEEIGAKHFFVRRSHRKIRPNIKESTLNVSV